jgi:hypothetical protein
MSVNLFNYTFNINSADSQNEILEAVKKNRVILPKPQSHFFMDLTNLSTESESFGPVGTSDAERQKKFRITSKFDLGGADVTKHAYAVVSGLLFVCRHGNSTDKVNVFLKPSTGMVCDIGIKIKYFVYRGIQKSDLCGEITQNNLNTVIKPNQAGTSLIRRVWDEFLEFNFPENQNADNHTILASQLGFDVESTPTDPNQLINLRFKNNSNFEETDAMALVNRGEKIGVFKETSGFEIVLDYGDSEFEKTETGFQLDIRYAVAKECIFNLNTDSNQNSSDIVGNIPSDNSVSEKIFRENIFHFMDPAAFYGAHVTGINSSDNEGKIFYGSFMESNPPGSATSYNTKADIYTNIVQKFLNQTKIYLYILGKRGRSFNFYNSVTAPISINTQPQPYATNGWPIKILDTANVQQSQYASFDLLFNNNSALNNDLLFSKDTNQMKYWNGFEHKKNVPNTTFNFRKPNINSQNIANYIFLNFADDITNQYHLENFGPVKLEPIFDINPPPNPQNNPDTSTYIQEPLLLAPNAIQWISYQKPKLLTINKEAFLFETKVVYWGFQEIPADSTATPPIVAHKEYLTRLYLFSPKEISQEYTNNTMDLGSASAYVSGYGILDLNKDMEKVKSIFESDAQQNFGKFVFNDANIFIWKGMVKDGTTTVTVLSLRHMKDGDYPKYHYQIGVTYQDIQDIQNGIPAANFNKYFKLEEEVVAAGSDANLKKYRLKIAYDDANGVLQTHSSSIAVYVYSIDGRFFTTINYANEFNSSFTYYNTMGKTTVEFLPKTGWDGEYGFDYMRKTSNSTSNFPAFDTITGVNPTQTNPNDPSPIPFDFDLDMYNTLKVNEYNAIPIPWRLNTPTYPNDTDSEYFTPWLSLAKDQTAELKIRLKVKEAGKLFFRFDVNKFDIQCIKISDSTLCGSIDPVSFTDNDGVSYDRQFTFESNLISSETFNEDIKFTIKCKTILNEDTAINIISIDKVDGKSVYRLAGRLMIYKNEPIPLKVLFVPIEIQLPGASSSTFYTGAQLDSHMALVEKYLSHSGIEAEIEINGVVNLIGDPKFGLGGDYLHKTALNQYIIRAGYQDEHGNEIEPSLLPVGYQRIKTYLKSKLAEQYLLLQVPDSTMILYFIKNKGGFENGTPQPLSTPPAEINSMEILGGFSNGMNTDVVVFDVMETPNSDTVDSLSRVTASHEIYHSLGVPHTFNNQTEDSNIYLFRGTETDNIMDYSNLAGKPRFSSFRWQWEIVRKNARRWRRNHGLEG